VYLTITWWVLGVAVVVLALMAFVLYRFRDDGSPGNPEQIHGNPTLEMAWTLIPVAIVIAIVIPTVRTIFQIADAAPDDAVEIRVVGKRWWWEFQYLKNDDDVKQSFVTANEMHLPVGRPVSLMLESDSVIHSFWVPRLGGKRDAVPGRVNRIWFTIQDEPELDDAGNDIPIEYRGECAEYCGEAHAYMRFDVFGRSEAGFRNWVAQHLEPEGPPAENVAAVEGQQLFGELKCNACHAIRGTTYLGRIGPDLTRFGTRARMGSAIMDTTTEHLTQWIQDPNVLKPGTSMAANVSRGPVGADDGMNLLKTNGNAQVADDARVYEDPERPGYWKFRDDADVDKVVEYLLSLK
jgi:cytochrome c oxidase subunit 2